MDDVQRAESKRPPGAFYLAIASLSLIPFIAQFSAVVLGPTLPAITLELNAPSDKAFWCATGYIVARTATTPIWGAFSEAFGRRISLLSALSLFVFASALCGAAQGIDWLLVGRIVRLLWHLPSLTSRLCHELCSLRNNRSKVLLQEDSMP
jgi:MFS family permease